ncbi:MAG: hypothetical protein JNM25_01940 [Planctomycetes bacterium]|nr:hypothetical protein [Planctomycetota bacterium]
MGKSRYAWGALLALGLVYLSCGSAPGRTDTDPLAVAVDASGGRADGRAATIGQKHPTPPPERPAPAPLAPFVEKGLDWLAGAQQDDGGWGAGSSSRQDIRDAHAVPTDPATTAVAAMALLRAGNGLRRGDFATTLQKANDYLLRTVEAAPADGPRITDLTGTQPQAKMGQNVDTALTAQFFARLLQEQDLDAALRPRVTAALDKCLRKIESSQGQDGSWAAGGWAPVLQSAQMSTALELGRLAGRTIDADKLDLARDYQRQQVVGSTAVPGDAGATPAATFTVRADAAAGVSLYASAANQRGVVAEAKQAEELVETAKREGRLDKDAKVEASTLERLGVDAPRAEAMAQSVAMNTAAKTRAFDENLLQGFGNNGGEEFLSYQMKSESLVIDGGEQWAKWSAKMHERLAKVQNQDGSWSGHHCITSPAFCTATALSCLTADRDVAWLTRDQKLAAK